MPKNYQILSATDFTMIEVEPPSYQQRIEILRAILMSSMKKFDEPFQGIYHKT